MLDAGLLAEVETLAPRLGRTARQAEEAGKRRPLKASRDLSYGLGTAGP